jgi:tRNA G18 (ribose-2'-O)-methylase SpoU
VFVVGGENGGVPEEVLARCDARVRVPMAGFIPCYNLQAAVSAVAVERLRQLLVVSRE